MEDSLKDKLYDHALKLLSMRAHSEKEIRRKLTVYLIRRKLTTALSYLDEIISKLKEKKYLSDEEFAEQFSYSRLSGKPRSKRVLEAELRQRGLSQEIIAQTLAEYDETEACKKAAARKARYSPEQLTAYLQRMGFPWECIKEAVSELSQQK